MSNKFFTDIDLQDNSIENTIKISSPDNNTNGLLIETPNNNTSKSSTTLLTDGGLIVKTGHSVIYSDDTDINVSTLDITASTSVQAKAPIINIKSTNETNYVTIGNDNTSIVSTTFNLYSGGTTTDKIITFTSKGDSFVDVNQIRSTYSTVSSTFIVGVTSTTTSINKPVSSTSEGFFFVNSDNIVSTRPIISYNTLTVGTSSSTRNTTLYGNFTQSNGDVSINSGTSNSTTIEGNSVNINPTTTINIGSTTTTKTITIGSTSNSSVYIYGNQGLSLKTDTTITRNYYSSTTGTTSSTFTGSEITASQYVINNGDANKVRYYWDDSTSALVFEKV